MPLVNTTKMLIEAQSNEYAVPAFNIENMEMAMSVIDTANKLASPVICAVSENALKYASASTYFGIVQALASDASVPVAIHVDHAESVPVVLRALRAGFTSVMIDGSKLNFRDNVNITQRVVDFCSPFHISIEGELGAVGGKIDYIDSDLLRYTNPDAAADFVRQTNVTSLAIAIGTAHGIYKDMPKLDYGTLDLIRSKVEVPLVLHGASGLSDEQLCTCVHKGICKVNIATELRQAYTTAIREYLDNDEKVYDPKKYSLVAMKAVSEVVAQKIQVLGSDGKCR